MRSISWLYYCIPSLWKKVSLNFIKNIHKVILGNIKPDLVIILKVKQKVFKLRLKKRKTKNRYDNFPTRFYLKAQRSFLKIAKNKKNYLILDSSKNNTQVEKIIQEKIKQKLKF